MKNLNFILKGTLLVIFLVCFDTYSFGNFRYNEKKKAKTWTDSTEIEKTSDENVDFENNTIWSKDSTECEFNGWAINSIFNIPILRYNINNLNTANNNLGGLEYFNAIGAGFSISWGSIYIKSKEGKSLIGSMSKNREIEMKNVFGLSLGFLFSKSESLGSTDSRVVFAPNISFQILDFQFGYGYELGTVENSAHRSIFTVTYGIPITKFTNVGSFLLSNPNIKGENKKIKFNGTF